MILEDNKLYHINKDVIHIIFCSNNLYISESVKTLKRNQPIIYDIFKANKEMAVVFLAVVFLAVEFHVV